MSVIVNTTVSDFFIAYLTSMITERKHRIMGGGKINKKSKERDAKMASLRAVLLTPSMIRVLISGHMQLFQQEYKDLPQHELVIRLTEYAKQPNFRKDCKRFVDFCESIVTYEDNK